MSSPGSSKQPLEEDHSNSEGKESSRQSASEVPSSASSAVESSPPSEAVPVEDRAALLDKARAFLASPEIRGQGLLAKSKFLEEKGLNAEEVGSLLKELVCFIQTLTRPELKILRII